MANANQQNRNRGFAVGGLYFSDQGAAPNPIPSGHRGWYVANGVLYQVETDGTTSLPPQFRPCRLLDTAVMTIGGGGDYVYSTTALTLTAKVNGALGNIDGVAPAVGDRIWRKIGDAADGPYTVTSLGSASAKAVFTRAADANRSSEFVDGKIVAIARGTAYQGTLQILQVASGFTMDTDTPALRASTATADALVMHLAGAETVTGAKSFSSGTLKVLNAGGTQATTLGSDASAARTATLPDQSGAVVMVTTAPTTAGQIPRASGAGAHTSSTATYPDTATQGDLLLATAANVIGSLPDVATGQVLASGGVGAAPAYTANPTVATLTTTGNVTVGGNLTVTGTTVSMSSEHVTVGDNYIDQNAGYTTAVAQPGGLTVRYLPTATADTVAAGGFTAGVPATSNPTIATAGAATFALADIVAIDGANNKSNNGLFEVLSHAANVLTLRGVGLTACVEDWTGNQLITDTTVAGTITKVGVSVLRAGTDGKWEQAVGNTTPFTFADVAAAGATTSASGTGAVTGATASDAGAACTGAPAATKIRFQQEFAALPAAAGTNYHAAYAGGAGAIDDLIGPWTRMVPPRVPQVATSAGAAAGNAIIDGTDPDGGVISETQACAGGGAAQAFTKAFTTITRFRYSVDPGGGQSVTLQTGPGFGLGVVASDIDAVGVDGVLEAPGSSDAATGSVVPTTAPNGAHTYAVAYRVSHVHAAGTLAFPNHSHAAGTLAGPSHTHTQSS